MAAFTTPVQQAAQANGLDGPAPADQPVTPIVHRVIPSAPTPASARTPPHKLHHKKAHAKGHGRSSKKSMRKGSPSPPPVSKGRR